MSTRSKCVAMAAVLGLAMGMSVHAATGSSPAQRLVQSVLDCEAQAFAAQADYQRAALKPADAGLQEPLVADSDELQRCAGTALPVALTLNGQGDSATRLQKAAGTALKALAAARAELQGGHASTPETRRLLQQNFHELAMTLDAVETLLISNGRVDPTQSEYLTHKMAQDLRHLEALYFSRGGGADKLASQAEMVAVAERVDNIVSTLQAATATHRELDKQWKPIQATWEFDRRATMDENRHTTGYVVGFETDRLVSLLRQLHV